MRELWPWIRVLAGCRRRLLPGIGLMLLTTLAAVGLLALAGWFITATALAGLMIAAGAAVSLGVFVPGAGIRAFAILRTAARYGERVYNHDTVLRLLADLRTSVFARLARLDPAALARLRPAEVLNRLTADIDALDNLYLRALAPPAAVALAVAAVIGLQACFAPAVAVATAGAIVAGGVIALAVGLVSGARLGTRVVHDEARLRERVLDLLRGLAEFRAYGAWAAQRETLDTLADRHAACQARLARRTAAVESGAAAAVHFATVAALGLGVILVRDAGIHGPVMVLLPLAVLGLAEAAATAPGAFVMLGRTRASAARLNAQVELEPVVAEPETAAAFPRDDALVFEHVTVRYAPAADPAIRDVSLEIAPGETVSLVGPSGAGKSTLADLACHLIEPETGTVRLGGVPVADLPRAVLGARMACLTQYTDLFADTIAANLRLARPEADPGMLWHALYVAGLDAFVRSLPDGSDTWVGEGGVRLSGGQARRLALARVVLSQAGVIVLDEPLTGLDGETARCVAQRLTRWLEGRTALAIGHEADRLPAATRRLRLSMGRLRPA